MKPEVQQVFISYSRTDLEACIALRSALEQAGLSVFQDEDIRKGDHWVTRLEDALQGCCAFVVLVGRDRVQRWVGAEVQVALIRHLSPHDDALRLPIFPILLEGTKPESLPPFLQIFQSDQWSPAESLPGTLLDAIRQHVIRIDTRHTFEGCPFLGLSAFGRTDAKLFFGRRKETLEALVCLGDQQQTNPDNPRQSGGPAYHRWLQIEGNSGAGKSSLVNAGMLPMIEQGALWARTGFENWRILGPMMPGKDPLGNLAETIERGLVKNPENRDSLKRLKHFAEDKRALEFAIRDFKNNEEQTAFLLILDQFEELFTFADEASRKQFDALLAFALEEPNCPLFLISTVRADFLDRFEYLPRLQTLYNSHCKRYFLPSISGHGLREIIEQPARLAGLDVSEITTAILKDAEGETGALPLVENALFTLWQQREAEGERQRLSGERYRQAGGIAGMLSTSADGLLQRIGQAVPKGESAALELLLRLTRINDEGRHTRQRITRKEAVFAAGNGNDALGEQVVRMLSGERSPDAPSAGHNGALRLITISKEQDGQQQDQQYVDLIHETLIRARGKDEKNSKRVGYWPMLYDYIEKNRDRDIYRQQLKFESERWQQSRGLGRLWNLAYSGSGNYRTLRVPENSLEGRFLSRSQWARSLLMLVLVLVLSLVVESMYWKNTYDLPLEAVTARWAYKLGKPMPIPALVEIPAGHFLMGSPPDEPERQKDEGPQHEVRIAEPFYLGVTEITFSQYRAFCEATRCDNSQNKGLNYDGMGDDNRPVINISWFDARSYARWLSAMTGKVCRLPSEAEWEYAARAGTDTPFYTGARIGTDQANFNGEYTYNGSAKGIYRKQTMPVGSFPPNAFGLHDMHGNVWEWVQDKWHDNYEGAPSDGSTWESEGSEARVLRGGSWGGNPGGVRAAARYYGTPDFRHDFIGFRVLCSSPIE